MEHELYLCRACDDFVTRSEKKLKDHLEMHSKDVFFPGWRGFVLRRDIRSYHVTKQSILNIYWFLSKRNSRIP